MKQLIKEPVVWFMLVAVVLFAAEGAISSRQDAIIINDKVTARITALWTAQMQRPPSEQELEALLNSWVKEEMFFREALRLGLDQNDTIVRRRLVQKYNFMMEEVESQEISQQDLLGYYQRNQDKYHLPERITFSNILFKSQNKATETLATMTNEADWRSLGVATLLPDRYARRSYKEVGYALGTEFASGLAKITDSKWGGPIQSSYGYHLVRIENRLPAEAIPFESIVDKVSYDFLKEQAEANLERSANALRSRYPLVHE
ncbi:MAG: peptidyl-prolyl cis-trans isomerase [Gammaproteobacteria bacterium]|jgi:peptidyl-prolyl cis-trans isomerase C|nr:peptidyl-prolyl cis-trans isomerase [Gammaproteobacteria bacterium]MBT5601543.1 peptidyl-prolyl cis-trans isomerase [Gammaproteobacteria bacterium]MBT6246679.1 peptidyl-prolyl cis-trans isomerase [Gammaproteobacteria bacterium]